MIDVRGSAGIQEISGDIRRQTSSKTPGRQASYLESAHRGYIHTISQSPSPGVPDIMKTFSSLLVVWKPCPVVFARCSLDRIVADYLSLAPPPPPRHLQTR